MSRPWCLQIESPIIGKSLLTAPTIGTCCWHPCVNYWLNPQIWLWGYMLGLRSQSLWTKIASKKNKTPVFGGGFFHFFWCRELGQTLCCCCLFGGGRFQVLPLTEMQWRKSLSGRNMERLPQVMILWIWDNILILIHVYIYIYIYVVYLPTFGCLFKIYYINVGKWNTTCGSYGIFFGWNFLLCFANPIPACSNPKKTSATRE